MIVEVAVIFNGVRVKVRQRLKQVFRALVLQGFDLPLVVKHSFVEVFRHFVLTSHYFRFGRLRLLLALPRQLLLLLNHLLLLAHAHFKLIKQFSYKFN